MKYKSVQLVMIFSRLIKRSMASQSRTTGSRLARRECDSCDQTANKGHWYSWEDEILKEHVRNHGEGKWNEVQRNTTLKRSGKSCRQRWLNKLNPNLKKGAFSELEERLIVELHAQFRGGWARMARLLPGRSDNEIKNFWNTRVRRRRKAGLTVYPPGIMPQYNVGRENQIQHYGFSSLPSPLSFPSVLSVVPRGSVWSALPPGPPRPDSYLMPEIPSKSSDLCGNIAALGAVLDRSHEDSNVAPNHCFVSAAAPTLPVHAEETFNNSNDYAPVPAFSSSQSGLLEDVMNPETLTSAEEMNNSLPNNCVGGKSVGNSAIEKDASLVDNPGDKDEKCTKASCSAYVPQEQLKKPHRRGRGQI